MTPDPPLDNTKNAPKLDNSNPPVQKLDNTKDLEWLNIAIEDAMQEYMDNPGEWIEIRNGVKKVITAKIAEAVAQCRKVIEEMK